MKLPKSLLDQVSYYEVKEVKKDYGIETKIVLHFKQWWKPRKTLKFNWKYVGQQSETVSIWKPCLNDLQLRMQLLEYFKDK